MGDHFEDFRKLKERLAEKMNQPALDKLVNAEAGRDFCLEVGVDGGPVSVLPYKGFKEKEGVYTITLARSPTGTYPTYEAQVDELDEKIAHLIFLTPYELAEILNVSVCSFWRLTHNLRDFLLLPCKPANDGEGYAMSIRIP